MKTANQIRSELDKNYFLFYNINRLLIKIDKNLPVQSHTNMLLNSKNLKGNVLFIGSGFCEEAILMKLKYPNLNITCFEGSVLINKIAKALIENAGVKIGLYNFIVEEYPIFNIKFDCVIINHVLEHIEDIDELMEYSLSILKDDGTIFMALPYGCYHFSKEHKHFFIVNDKRYENENRKLKGIKNVVNMETFLEKHGLKYEITVFNEETFGLSHKDYKHSPNKEQLDFYIEAKKC